MPTATASWSPRTYRKSSGNSASIGNSVEPGLPNIVVIPCSRKRSNVTSRTLAMAADPTGEGSAGVRPVDQEADGRAPTGGGAARARRGADVPVRGDHRTEESAAHPGGVEAEVVEPPLCHVERLAGQVGDGHTARRGRALGCRVVQLRHLDRG